MKSKKVLILSDLHCGNMLGLTPPQYYNEFREVQETGWKFFTEEMKKLGPVDLLLLNGDLVDGPGKKDSLCHITTNVATQRKIAIECLRQVKAAKSIFIRGTGFHVTTDLEIEDDIAAYFGSEIYDERKINVNGCILHCRHTSGKGGTSYGSATSLQRSAVVKLMDDAATCSEQADIYIRSHIHEAMCIERSVFTALTTPALKFKGESFGRKCTGFLDYGFTWLEIRGKKDFDVHMVTMKTGGEYKAEEITKI